MEIQIQSRPCRKLRVVSCSHFGNPKLLRMKWGMGQNYLNSVLALLRLIKSTMPPLSLSTSTYSFLEHWAKPETRPEVILRVAVYIQAQIVGAENLVRQSDISDERKSGVLEVIEGLAR